MPRGSRSRRSKKQPKSDEIYTFRDDYQRIARVTKTRFRKSHLVSDDKAISMILQDLRRRPGSKTFKNKHFSEIRQNILQLLRRDIVSDDKAQNRKRGPTGRRRDPECAKPFENKHFSEDRAGTRKQEFWNRTWYRMTRPFP